MVVTTRDTTKKKRPKGTGTPIMLRLQPDQLAAVDAWAAKQADAPSRPEAIRRLIGKGLHNV